VRGEAPPPALMLAHMKNWHMENRNWAGAAKSFAEFLWQGWLYFSQNFCSKMVTIFCWILVPRWTHILPNICVETGSTFCAEIVSIFCWTYVPIFVLWDKHHFCPFFVPRLALFLRIFCTKIVPIFGAQIDTIFLSIFCVDVVSPFPIVTVPDFFSSF